MSHECEVCGQECYCDMDDCAGMEQPEDCPHFDKHMLELDESEEDYCGEN